MFGNDEIMKMELALKNKKVLAGIIFFLFVTASGFTQNYKNHKQKTLTSQEKNTADVELWLTKADQSVLFEKQKAAINFFSADNDYPIIEIDSSKSFQTMDGFGFSLTDGSGYVIYKLPSERRDSLLRELFSTKEDGIGISYLRVSIGGSDLSFKPYTYDDMPNDKTDVDLEHFSMDRDYRKNYLIPLLKEILEVNPDIKILGSPWSAPAWMKSNNSLIGGSLEKQYFDAYAQYFVKYIEKMKKEGITIDAVTPQNEPLHDGNNPSMYMSAKDEGEFIKNNLGPAFKKAGLNTKIQIWDHNANHPSYPLSILEDPEARKYIDGSAFHLYNGPIEALSTVHDLYPKKNIYFTEQYTNRNSSFADELRWHIKNLIVGATRNWSKNVLEWNLATDKDYGPHTDKGGCDVCQGGLTIDNGNIQRNVSYYIIASASKFIRPDAKRISSNLPGNLQNVAFKNKDGSKVLIVLNDGEDQEKFNISFRGKSMTSELDPGSVGTYVWH